MTIDFWGLGLQAVNVLILVWLLGRVFWRPVSQAIARRQEAATALIASAKATQGKADAALAEASQARATLASERESTLDATRREAEAATKATLTDAHAKADALLAAAQITVDKTADAARKANATAASDLALTIAGTLLTRMASPAVQAQFLPQLIAAIERMPARDRAALMDEPMGIDVVTAQEVGANGVPLCKTITDAVHKALGGTPTLRFVTDPDLIAGLELHTPHFVLRNSWQADLAQIAKAVKDAA